MYIAIGQKKRAKRLVRKKAAAKRNVVDAAGVEGKSGKTQITINEGGRKKEKEKKHVWRRDVVTSNSQYPMRIESVRVIRVNSKAEIVSF